ncbi:Nucleolar protein 56 [Portunus trituberculatus]|uniref:Nucleolar protein 56 n=1 Tax=Portunus trituberculatus TaxID=210409 RepID=A0A5B7IK84_PORTR|nr:Nucleolar protein 56 [Portunus trituberculatus]
MVSTLINVSIILVTSQNSESLSSVFGEHLREQVEDRLAFYETGNIPRKNAEVMKEALEEHNAKMKEEKKTKKRKLDESINGKP